MSALIHIKTLVIQHIPKKELRDAVMGLINAVDSDLDEANYNQSSDVDEAIAALDAVLVNEGEEEELIDVVNDSDINDDEEELNEEEDAS